MGVTSKPGPVAWRPSWKPDTAAYRAVLDDLVDTRDIQERLELSRVQVVNTWRARDPNFPKPVKVLHEESPKPVYLFSWLQIKAWWDQWTTSGDARRLRHHDAEDA